LTSTTGRKNEAYHLPVLVEETVSLLVTRPDGVYLDLTCGGGGHMKYLAGAVSREAILVGLDRDPEAISATSENLESIPQKKRLFNLSFARVDELPEAIGMQEVDGILLDLGLSSHQLDAPYRGFAFMQDGPLDMRMGKDSGAGAEEIINNYSERELTLLFKKYGEEKRARRAAVAIIRERTGERITGTGQLRRILEPLFPSRERNASLARIFQAIRIEVNDELGQLAGVLPKAVDFLRVGGRLVVIAYHSLEDRIVKRFIAEKVRGCTCPPDFPICVCGKKPSLKNLTRKAVRPGAAEIEQNPRAESARLRAAEKLG